LSALIDTSVVVGGPDLADELPDAVAISVITVGELRAGVSGASSDAERDRRRARLDAVRATFEPIPVDEHVANHYGDLLAAARDAGRSEKATDLLIAATAAATDRHLITADRAQARLAESAGITVRLLGSGLS
jgi:toxin FitB